MSGIEYSKRNTIFCTLDKYCHFAKEDDYIEVTKWSNEEGYDIVISSGSKYQIVSLTLGEIELLNVLLNIKE